MSAVTDVGPLPGLVALDAFGVLRRTRRGASVQLDGTYFDGQLAALRSCNTSDTLDSRTRIVRESRTVFDGVDVEIDSLTERNLLDASERLRGILRQLPEVAYLTRCFPGTCVAVPEWLRVPAGVEYGARVYFFRDDDAPEPAEIVRENVAAVVADDRPAFERFQGRLHGYPDCCIDHFHDRTDDTPPEWRAVAPLADRVGDVLDAESGEPSSVAAVLREPFEVDDARAFFTREFFPEPGCETARERGTAVRDVLADAFPAALVRDYVRITVGWNYLVAATVRDGDGDGDGGRPTPGALGPEHLLFYLPMKAVLSIDRYQ